MKTIYKTILFFGGLLCLSSQTNAQQLNRAPSLEGYELIYSDEFNGAALDGNAWNIEVNGNGGGNNELQYYTAGNISVSGGALKITAKRENYGGKAFTSGRLNTMGKVAFKHGIVQASIKLPQTANGLWPAFWLMGNDMNDGISWPYCGEIDVLEAGGMNGISTGTQDRFFISALHWGPYVDGQHPMYSTSTTADYSIQDGNFHLFTMVWDEAKISMYLDDIETPYFEMNINDKSQQNSAGNYFHKRFFLLLNVAVGGTIPGIYDAGGITALNNGTKTMEVDYVRVYQKSGEKDYVTPTGSEGGDDPEIELDETTRLGAYGSLSLDDNGMTTFDFANSTDYVIIGASQGVMDQMGRDNIRANYSVDDVNNFLYIWENTYTSLNSEGVNSFGLEEPYNHFRVNSVGWSGLGYASSGSSGPGKDMSMLDEDGYILHFAMRGTDALMHSGHAVGIGNASFTIGAAPFNDNGKVLPVLGDFKRDGRWCSFDIPVSVLKSLNPVLFNNMKAVKDNVMFFLSGGVAGAELQFDNVFFYKNSTIDTDPPTTDSTTVIGKYATKSLDKTGHTTFDFSDGYDYVIIGASQGVIDQMGQDNIRADYSVDDVNNFLYVWENTYHSEPSEGVNSFGLEEPYNHFVVNSVGWSGLGYASQIRGKNLSMLVDEDGYILHFAMKGDDILRHANHTIGIGSAQFVIGNATTGPVMFGDYRRDGEWYSFDIPFSVIKQMNGNPFTAEGGTSNFLGNVFYVLSGGATGTELQFDNVFFYKSHSQGGDSTIDPELGQYGSKALDENGQPTFDLSAHKDYVLISLGEEEANSIKDVTLADYRVDDVNNFLYVWENTYNSATASGVNSFGYEEPYTALTVGTMGWSGMGFASTGGSGTGKNLTMIDDSYTLHIAFKGNDVQHISHAVGVGSAHFALGQTGFNDNGTVYGLLGDFKRDGEWYNFDIPFSEIQMRANPVFANPANYMDNVISILSGATTGVGLNVDAIFFYRDKTDDAKKGDLNNDGQVDITDMNILINLILGEDNIENYGDRAYITDDDIVDIADLNAMIDIILGL